MFLQCIIAMAWISVEYNMDKGGVDSLLTKWFKEKSAIASFILCFGNYLSFSWLYSFHFTKTLKLFIKMGFIKHS